MARKGNKYLGFLDHEAEVLARLDHDKVEILRSLWDAVPEKLRSFRDLFWGDLEGHKFENQPRFGGFYQWFWGMVENTRFHLIHNPDQLQFSGTGQDYHPEDMAGLGCRDFGEMSRKVRGLAKAWEGKITVTVRKIDDYNLNIRWRLVL